MRRLLAAAAAAAVLLSACGDDAQDRAPADPTTTTESTATATTTEIADEAPTSAAPTTVTPTSASAETTTAEPAPEAAPAPTTAAPARPAVTACDDDGLSQDILGFPGGVSVDFCEDGWAFAAYPNAPGAPEFIAEQVDGRWFHAVAMGDPVCQDDLSARGAPAAVSKLLPPCVDAPAPTAGPTGSPTDPVAACVVSTKEYGDTHADLVAVTCDGARAEWGLAEANTEPSWTIPWVTPTGWECFVTPYDATSKAAGSCYGPDGTAYFTLYLP
ncbi:hypothetical protein [Ornithinimicrobium cryptoxanthini]|uniref:Uncharacterized protein n=1 Tax=Ornithinimicrobium cryptoxanthini TaxID=2934161 RepID=A0ABY4YLE6_9MICO|nr:hypothetical protein [Ornithinimicrobium cryptoxanthini]USQ77617.1 hypothetical protein NF557_06855 [Ornithinimicrobium cryptoxanthini]